MNSKFYYIFFIKKLCKFRKLIEIYNVLLKYKIKGIGLITVENLAFN